MAARPGRRSPAAFPTNENVNAVREDPKRKGLLFAGTERAVYVSFDDGDHWQSLRLNMPATSIRDLTIKDNDLAVATHGRGFWILDDITPLRQWSDKVDRRAMRSCSRPSLPTAFAGTPTPILRCRPTTPTGQNPPDGAIINYYLKSASSAPVTLEIMDSAGNLVRRYSTADPVPQLDPRACDSCLLGAPAASAGEQLPASIASSGTCIIAPVPGIKPDYPIAAVPWNTAPAPTSPWIMPGEYTLVLTVDGQKYTQPLTVQMDPRVKTPVADLQKQFDLSQQVYQELLRVATGNREGSLGPRTTQGHAREGQRRRRREDRRGQQRVGRAGRRRGTAADDAARRPKLYRACAARCWKCWACFRKWTPHRPRRQRRQCPS